MIEELPARACHDLLAADPTIVLIDVRSPEEFAQGHPAGALNVPIAFMGPYGMTLNQGFQKAVEAAAPARERRVILLCAAGSRSMRACEVLEDAGYRDLVNLGGGFNGGGGARGEESWQSAGLPVSTDPGDRGWTALQARAGRRA